MRSLSDIAERFFDNSLNHEDPLHKEYTHYIENSYPSNHTYKIAKKKLIPKRKLAARCKKIDGLFPKKITSLLDLGCSKGFFVFSAANDPHCTRSLGVDVSSHDINVCRWVKQQIDSKHTHFEKIRLHNLAERIQEFGGPFQTILIQNIYQYLYFGSDPFPESYLDHEIIFKNLREICAERIIFNNRITLKDCQNAERIELAGSSYSQNYTEEKIRTAASKYFTIIEHGTIGRYPLWTLEIK